MAESLIAFAEQEAFTPSRVTDPQELELLFRLGYGGMAEVYIATKARSELSVVKRMYEHSLPGKTEQEIWAELHYENIRSGGEWLETRLLAAGPRTNPWFQECSGYVCREGDMLSFDTDMIGPYGYCADLSRSWTIGHTRMSNEQRALYGLTHLPRTYPCAEIDAVCARMLQAQCFSYAAVRRALERKAALQPSAPTTEALTQSGPEIRALTDYATFWDTHTQMHSTTPNESEDNSNANVYP